MDFKTLSPSGFADLKGWQDDDHSAAFAAFRRSAIQCGIKQYRTGSLGLCPSMMGEAFAHARENPELDRRQARDFFEHYFQPACLKAPDGGRGFVTGFYEPIHHASSVKTERFSVPLRRRPADLVNIEPGNVPGLDPYLAFARKSGADFSEYHDRAAIEAGALQDQSLEFAFIESKVDAFFIHVQGAARLLMEDGMVKRITYAAKSGQRFTGAGKVLAELGEIALEQVTMQSIRAWLAKHPERVDEILQQNRSYIFFRDEMVANDELGPVAAAKVPLMAGRSLAVDRLIHTFGTPFHIASEKLDHDHQPFQRLMIAQDTGSAIVGPARGDLFIGSGDEAGAIAGQIRHAADFHILLPRQFFQAQAS